jgi:hypothetical protein
MRKVNLILVMLLCLSFAAQGANFTATLDRDSMTLGEQVTLALTFEGGSPQNVPSPSVPGLDVTSSGSSQNLSIINGAMTSTVTISYTLTPRRTGEFVIPALTAEVDGQQLTTQPIRLTVLKADAPTAAAVNSGNEIAFMRLVLPQKKVYVGEMLTAQLQICVRDDVQNFGNFQLSAVNADGVAVGKSSEAGRFRTQIGNRVYTVIPLSYVLTVVKSGELTLGPFTASAVAVLPSPNQGDFPFFNQGEQKQVSLATDPVTLESQPLPDQNRPANFNGAVGDFTMTVNVGPTNLTVGDPVTIRVVISGRGTLDSVNLPDQSALQNFKVYPPTTKTEFTDQLGLEGRKTFEEIVTPQNDTVHEWPSFAFSYFNPGDGQYHTLAQAAVPLAVRAAGATALPSLALNKTPATDNQAPQDILPIKEKLGTLQRKPAPLVASPAFLAVQCLPVLAFIAALVWRKRVDNLANNPRLRRQLAVAQLVTAGLLDLKKYAAENRPDEFFSTLIRLLQEQLGERLDCPASAITGNVIEEHSALRNAPPATLDALRELFQLCNQARYAPVRGSTELNSVAKQFEKLIGELQQLKP